MGVGGAGGCGLGVVMTVYDSIWYWRTRLPKRKGQRCRVVARGSLNSALVEFEADRLLVVTSRYAVRKVKP